MSKVDQLRALRERRFEESRSTSQPTKRLKLQRAKSVSSDVNKLINRNAEHQAKWRQANVELNRQRARDGMRKRRANAQ